MKLFSGLGGRLLVLLVFIGIGGGFFFLTQKPPSDPKDKGPSEDIPLFTSSRQCKSCHAALWDEWSKSHHAIAYTNPEVRKLSNDFRQKECQDCHLPRPLFETGLAKPPLPRQSRPDEGVDCLACHMRPDGRILGLHARPKAGCKPLAQPRLGSVDLCKTCHNQHKTTDQWAASPFAKKGVSCNDCHMPKIEGKPGRRSHWVKGAHDLATLRSAARLGVRVSESKILVEVENKGAGHNLPTEERHRAVDVIYRILPAGTKAKTWDPPFTRLYRFRQPYLGDPGPNTQLPSGQTWKGSFDIPAALQIKGTRVQVRLLYQLTPFKKDEEGSLLYEIEKVLR